MGRALLIGRVWPVSYWKGLHDGGGRVTDRRGVSKEKGVFDGNGLHAEGALLLMGGVCL